MNRGVAKITRVSGTADRPVEHPFEYDDTFVLESLPDGTARFKIGLRKRQASVLKAFAAMLKLPCRLLYVLHTARSDTPLGRYESPDLNRAQVEEFIDRFGRFIEEDARHDLWILSESGPTIVLDRYNMMYAYGTLDRFRTVLKQFSVVEVADWAAPKVPYPHALHYHVEWDDAANELLEGMPWTRKQLRDVDVQVWTGPQPS